MRLFITGASSFVAAELVKQCRARGVDFIGVDAAASGPATITADIRAPDLAKHMPEGLDAVVHLAAVSRDADCRRDPLQCYEVNVAGTINVFQAALSKGARQLIFASTEWVYDSFEPGVAKTEDALIDCSRLSSDYALSKLAAESALRVRHHQTGIPVTVLRFGIIYGPRHTNWSAVEALLHTVACGRPVEVGSRATARCFVHVSDIASAILAAVGSAGHDTINIAGDLPVTLGEIVDLADELLGRRPEVIETNPDQPSIRNISNVRAKERLGWQPQIGIAVGLRSVADFLELRRGACPVN